MLYADPHRVTTTFLHVALGTIGLLVCLLSAASATDWPMFRADASRSGYTPDSLTSNLELVWTYEPLHSPKPAWQGPDTRMTFDYAYRTVVADGTLFFGSSADGKVYALDTATGQERWTFFTGGPVRFAPAVWRDRVFVGGDDGWLYCLSAAEGNLLWKKRGGPRESMVLGNDRMISRWPIRGGPVILDDTVYFAAGIWPSEGIFIYALDAATGDVVWLNDTSGSIEMDQPHPGARAKSGVSAQGYLAASAQHLLVPTGRAVPAVFDRTDGTFRYFRLQQYGHKGGSSAIVIGDILLNSDDAYWIEDGEPLAGRIRAHAVTAGDHSIVYADDGRLNGIDRARLWMEKETVDRKGNPTIVKTLAEPSWTITDAYEGNPTALIMAGQVAVLGTDRGKVVLLDLTNRSLVSTKETDGIPLDLAAADGRLYVSTDRGSIHCFGSGMEGGQAVISRTKDTSPYEDNSVYEEAAREIIQRTGVTAGYCLDLGCGDGRLVYELAKQTDLVIYGIDSDPDMIATARERLDAAGLYGLRVTVHEGSLSDIHLPPYFANLVVWSRSVEGEPDAVRKVTIPRSIHPYGVVCVGKPGAMDVAKSKGEGIEGAGEWTHQYCDAANTLCSSDVLVKPPLGMLWFKDNPLEMPSRHGRGPAPLFSEGRLFVEGNHAIEAVDAYNGRHLWEYPLHGILIPYDQEHLVGTAATGSNFCVAGDSVYVCTENRCLRLDTATGKKLAEFEAPLRTDGTKGTWGYLACVDGILFGSLVNEEHIVKWAFVKSDMSDLFSESESCL
jgi:outer membrane protein assembly factor BamB